MLHTSQFLQHLQTNHQPLVLKRNGQAPIWGDETVHQLAYTHNPELYALLGVAGGVTPEQRATILFQLLSQSRRDLSVDMRYVLDNVIIFLLAVLPADMVLTTFLSVRRVRANHKHTRRAILTYILNHPALLDLAHRRRPTLVDCLEHAVGKNTMRACAKYAATNLDEKYLRRHLLRFANDAQQARQVVLALYRYVDELATTDIDYTISHVAQQERLEPTQERPKTVTATNRGDISATLVHIYRGGTSTQLTEALAQYVHEAAEQLPTFGGKVALVVDASTSLQGYGEREYCILAQAVAFQKVLAKNCTELWVQVVGGEMVGQASNLPRPQGHTDLAMALVEALEQNPDLVLIISDGYENYHAGDLARVVATLPQLGIEIPVVFCQTQFTHKDDLSLRQPVDNLPRVGFWHQADFEPLMLLLFAMTSRGQASVRDYLYRRLHQLQERYKIGI